MPRARILVWGAGAIGGTIGANLARAGNDLLLVDRDQDHVAAMNRGGLAITGPIDAFRVPVRAATPDEVEGSFTSILLCVKAQDTEAAAAQLRPHLAADGHVVSLQNGLNEYVLSEAVGAARTIGAFINFGADYMEPGVIHHGGRGAVVVGEIDGRLTARAQELHRLLRQLDARAVLTANIWGYLWSKLAYGALLFATALTDDSIADCFAMAKYRPLYIALAREVAAVATASGVRLEPFDGFEPAAFVPGAPIEQAQRSLDGLVAHNRRSAKTHSGIWRDLAVRKRRTEGEAQLGPILRIAGERGSAAPITARLLALIKAVEEGRAQQGMALLDDLMAASPTPAS